MTPGSAPTVHTAPDEVAVRIGNLHHRFATGTQALAGIDLFVRTGELLSIIGPSGCGKSTLLRIVAGLEPPSEGQVSVHHDVAAGAGPGIGMVFQQPTLMPWTSVEANVRLPLDLRGMPAAEASRRARLVLSQVGLTEFAEAYPRELSGGMQMRASLARALVTEPGLLLMDEPFGALDEITRARLDRDLLDLQARRTLTVLFVTHSIYEAVYLSSRVVVMSPRPGRIAGELAVDEPSPRGDAFRTSERFAQLCARLHGMMVEAGAT
jgi:NitT/TauT family transport system ATP-binding protein